MSTLKLNGKSIGGVASDASAVNYGDTTVEEKLNKMTNDIDSLNSTIGNKQDKLVYATTITESVAVGENYTINLSNYIPTGTKRVILLCADTWSHNYSTIVPRAFNPETKMFAGLCVGSGSSQMFTLEFLCVL